MNERVKIPKLLPSRIPDWPRLAWVAKIQRGDLTVSLWHGKDVEVSRDFFVEGVWDSEYSQGEFDKSELFFGSGGRIGDGRWIFASACTTVDRLWIFHTTEDEIFISNSLPALMAVSGAKLKIDYLLYRADVHSIVKGLAHAVRRYPTESGDLEVIYYLNLVWDGTTLAERPKPAGGIEWTSYDEYRDYLFEAADRIGINSRDDCRHAKLEILATISSGYDSTAASVVAMRAGAERAVTLKKARSLIPRSDSGAAIASRLGLVCQSFESGKKFYVQEEWFIAALGWSMDLNLSVIDYPENPVLLFTGFHGDKIWDLSYAKDPLRMVRGDPSGLGLCEFRLMRGIINIPVPFFGLSRAGGLNRISNSAELRPWSVGGNYDRPIPRRIVEECGVDRNQFGRTKSATTIDEGILWPQSPRTRERFEIWLHSQGLDTPNLDLFKLLNTIERSIFARLFGPLGYQPPARHASQTMIHASGLLFYWANTTIAQTLSSQLRH